MNSLADLGSWGSGILGQGASVATNLASKSFEKGTDLVKASTKAVKASLKENISAASFVGGATHSIQDPRERRTRDVKEVAFLAEGAFGAVLKVVESGTGREYALKKIKCQEGVQVASTFAAAELEANILTRIPPHPNIILCLGYTSEQHGGGCSTVNLLMELCGRGHLLDMMDQKGGKLNAKEILEPFVQITDAVRHLHAQSPPIQHRDLKVENVLRGNDGNWKLCDFGSCSTETVPAEELSRARFLKLQEEIDKTVTMLYRPPEMADIELNVRKGYMINEQVDVWMLGCILYTLAFYRHPFQDNATAMAITNAKYFIPSDHSMSRSAKLCGLIHWLLAADPRDRPTTTKLLDVCRNIGKCKYEDIKALMPTGVQDKIRKLDMYAAGKDTGDLPVGFDFQGGAKVPPARPAAAAPSKSSPPKRQQSTAASAVPSAEPAAPVDTGGFDINFALATPAPAAASSAPAAPAKAAAVTPQAAPVSDLLGFGNTPPAGSAMPVACPPPAGELGDFLGFNSAAPATASQGTEWSADFDAFASTPVSNGASAGAGFGTPSFTSPPQSYSSPAPGSSSGFTQGPSGSPRSMQQPMNAFSAQQQGIAGYPMQIGSSAPVGVAPQTGANSWPAAAAPAQAAPTPPVANGGFGSFDFADFTSAPPPPAPVAPAQSTSAGPTQAMGNLLDF